MEFDSNSSVPVEPWIGTQPAGTRAESSGPEQPSRLGACRRVRGAAGDHVGDLVDARVAGELHDFGVRSTYFHGLRHAEVVIGECRDRWQVRDAQHLVTAAE